MGARAGERTKLRVARAGIATVLLGASWLVAIPTNASGVTGVPGTIEICKGAAYGMGGRLFQFSLNAGNPITVAGGSCSGPIAAPAGPNTVAEIAHSDTVVVAIHGRRIIKKDLNAGTVMARVVAGSTATNETKLTFVDKLSGPGAMLKICKIAGDPELVGKQFSFTESGGPAFKVAAGTPAAPNCSAPTAWAAGTAVDVQELAAAGTAVSAITVSDNRGSNIDINAGSVTATMGPGVTVVTYTNVPNGPQTGLLSVCKKALAGDDTVVGTFMFTVTGTAFTQNVPVAVGTCSASLVVPAGQVFVTEAAQGAFYTSAISATPAVDLVSSNLANRTAVLGVPVGDDVADQVQVTFENASTGRISVCNTTAAASAPLAGTKLTFDVVSSTAPTGTVSVVAGPVGATVCSTYALDLPVGSTVSITEESTDGAQVTGVGVSPVTNDNGSTATVAKAIVGQGIASATFTNRATGEVSVCVTAASTKAAAKTFQLSVNGGAAISVHAGQCSVNLQVPVGTATVAQTPIDGIVLQSVAANDNRLVSAPTANPATVSVPFGGAANLTVVTFTDA